MQDKQWIRGVLWTTAVFNLIAGALFLFPASALGQWAGVPTGAPAIYTLITVALVWLFGGAYAWMAQGPLVRPMIVMAMIGKSVIFLGALILALYGYVEARLAAIIFADQVFAGLFAVWLRSNTSRTTQ